MSTVIQSQSQTDAKKVHHVDFSRAMLRKTPGWSLKQCCTCGSSQVCRHIQNVHEYLFVGRRAYDVEPFMNELLAMKQEAEFDFADDPKNDTVKGQEDEIAEIIKAAETFHAEYKKVPEEEMKANYMLEKQAPDTDKAVGAAVGVFKKK